MGALSWSPGGCCCECGPCLTIEEYGLPDSLVVNFAVLTSDDEGMPEDIVTGTCAGGNPFMRFTHSAAIVELLSSITFDLVEIGSSGEAELSTVCGCCCYRYEGRTDYTPECPTDSPDMILLGDSPFIPRLIAVSTDEMRTSGTDIANPNPASFGVKCDTVGPPFDSAGCCGGTPTSDGEGGWIYPQDETCIDYSFSWEDGDFYQSLKVYCSANLYICITGSIVTICISLSIENECQVRSGDGYVERYRLTCSEDPACGIGTITSGSHTTDCDANTPSLLVFNASADLSAVEGDTIWDKIKNAPAESWVSDYDTVHCNCGPSNGCTDSSSRQDCACSYQPTLCISEKYELGYPIETAPECPLDVLDDAPVDMDCLYAIGTIDIGFSDE